MKLSDRNWKEFYISELNFQIINSKAYHKINLTETNLGLPYISRTNRNNGYDCSITLNNNLIINPTNTIVFGAENATFFYQPFKYITGNKMYYIAYPKFNKFNCLFLVAALNKSIQKCGFGFGQGLTGTRLENRSIYLPITSDFQPDYEFMEAYMREKEENLKSQYKKFISSRIKKTCKKPQEPKGWKEFEIGKIFASIKRGKRLIKGNQIKGNIPYISSSSLNNGVDNFINNNNKIRKFSNCLSIANSGSVGTCFYEPFEFIASDHITHLKDNYSKYQYLFLANSIQQIKIKYNFNREINDNRIKKEKIMLPITQLGEPDYKYMENYMKYLEQKKLQEYINYIERKQLC